MVSIIWSLIAAFVVAGFWSLGEFLYLGLTRPRASYQVSVWSLGVGALVFVWMLYVSQKARLNIAQGNQAFGGLSASDHDRAAGELSEFLTGMMEVDGPALGITAVQAADVAARLYADTDGEIDLRSPRTALASRPALLTELTEAVIQLQKAGRQFETPGTIIWVNTLPAELMPELRPSVQRMWSLISRRGFLYVAEGAMRYEEKTGRSLSNNNTNFRVVPEGCGE